MTIADPPPQIRTWGITHPAPALVPDGEAHAAGENFGPNLGPVTPIHRGKPTNNTHQRASKTSSIYKSTKSAKPPSPAFKSGRPLQNP
jgi:hypothetical protein